MKKLIIPILILGLLTGYTVYAGTFGYDTVGTDNDAWNADYLVCKTGNPGESGIATSLHVYISDNWGAGEKINMALYTVSGTTLTKVVESTENSTGGTGWVEFAIEDTAVSDQDYAICYLSDSYVIYKKDDGEGTNYYFKASIDYDTGFPETVESVTEVSNMVSAYATYTATEAPASTDSTIQLKAGTLKIKAGELKIK